MPILKSLLAAAVVMAVPFAAMAHCSPQHTVSITPVPAAPQTPIPTPPTVGG